MIKHLKCRPVRSAAQLLLSVVLQLFFAQTILAQGEIIPDGCKEFISSVSGLSYENELHKRWYISWWDGKCRGLPPWPFCQSKPYWGTFIEPVLKRNPNADRGALLKNLCTLGETVGHEFARDNNWRCVDRDDVSAWSAKIGSRNGDIFQKIAAVRLEAETKIKGSRSGKPCLQR
jgi:hypothetical protein